ncbi:UbiH/UbiF/VisC/COQ6 family ubiquinone biosynthesis hydroxylase [Pinirhizobacter sp.]|jgi:2-octaprenyl-3-methyl-6-methoxy-1,4-benzoquinol hydroxylase/2-octaprenylphenol hydroxylase|uniref:UbiH/UbiF/VisC/COQ6 family ubiquinone biosynthesis hydroxylase n=1 Tax=Pinirhizobacter sp. TaxID=2950432 RepID=UPI002F3E556D
MNTRRSSSLLDVAVVGGGMVGAAAALALAREGFHVSLLEARDPAPWNPDAEVDLRVVGLAESSVSLLEELGAWDAIRAARASAYRHMHVWDETTGSAIDFDASDRGWKALGWIVENNLVQQELFQRLAGAGVTVRCPATVSAWHADAERSTLTLDDGSTMHARVVVAADGGASPLRGMAGIDARGRDYGQRAVVAHVSHERPHQATAWQRFLRGGPLALLPLADGRSSIVWSLPEAEAARILSLSDVDFMRELGAASDFRLGPILATSKRAAFPLRMQLAARYQAERFVLLGDAAHTVHPLAGQGVNIGLRDVAELRDTLLQARARGADIGATHVLRRYARRRRSADQIDALSFDALARIYAVQWPPVAAARALGVATLNRVAPLKNLLIAHASGR